MWPKAILFDLDGTLVESAPDLQAAVNRLIAEDGHAPLSLEAVRGMIGHGVRKLVERAYAAQGAPLDGPGLDARSDRMMAIYGEGLTVDTVLMPGATDALAACRGAGARVAVVTNKPEAFSRAILAHFGIDADVVVGGDTGPARKPAPDMLLHAVATLGVPTGHAVMVGDGPADIDAARAAGMRSVAVRGGYTTVPADALGAHVVIDTLRDLPAAIAALPRPG